MGGTVTPVDLALWARDKARGPAATAWALGFGLYAKQRGISARGLGAPYYTHTDPADIQPGAFLTKLGNQYNETTAPVTQAGLNQHNQAIHDRLLDWPKEELDTTLISLPEGFPVTADQLFDDGGVLPTGTPIKMFGNRPDFRLTPEQTAAFKSALAQLQVKDNTE